MSSAEAGGLGLETETFPYPLAAGLAAAPAAAAAAAGLAAAALIAAARRRSHAAAMGQQPLQR